MMPQAIALAKKPHVIVASPGRWASLLTLLASAYPRQNPGSFGVDQGLQPVRNVLFCVRQRVLTRRTAVTLSTSSWTRLIGKLLQVSPQPVLNPNSLIDQDFGPTVVKILKFLPRERRTFFFSATMSSKVESLQRVSLHDPVKVSVSSSKYATVSTLVQNYIFVPHMHKDTHLVFLCSEFAGKTLIIFTRTVLETQRLALLLRALGMSAIPLHGGLSQSARLGALNKFRTGSRSILVATDVAARGLDIPNVDCVINFDLPQDSKTYVHRVGRTARAGKSGLAISIVTQ